MFRLAWDRPTPKTPHTVNLLKGYLTLYRRELKVNLCLSPTFFLNCFVYSRTTAYVDRARCIMIRRATATTITKPNVFGLSRRRGVTVLRFITESVIPPVHSTSNLTKKMRPKLYSNPTFKTAFGVVWAVVGMSIQ